MKKSLLTLMAVTLLTAGQINCSDNSISGKFFAAMSWAKSQVMPQAKVTPQVPMLDPETDYTATLERAETEDYLRNNLQPEKLDHSKNQQIYGNLQCSQEHNILYILEENPTIAQARFSYNAETALHIAVERKLYTTMILLLEMGADVNAQDKYGNTPLHRAVKIQDASYLISILIENGADTTITNRFEKTAFEVGASYFEGQKSSLEYSLKARL
jgi:ankyrin repeat protein